jgi:hypothetical protein
VMDFPHLKMTRCFILNLACFTQLITFYIFSLLFFTLRFVLMFTAKTKGKRTNNIEDMQYSESSIVVVLNL